MKTFYNDITDEHKKILWTNRREIYFDNKWSNLIIYLYDYILKQEYPNLIKHYNGLFLTEDIDEDTIYKELHWLNNTDTPMFFVYEYNEDKTICRGNIFDQLILKYSSFEINILDLPPDNGMQYISKQDASKYLKNQIFTESTDFLVNYLVKEYGFTFDETPLIELFFENNL